MTSRIVIVCAVVVAAILLWFGPFAIPNWAKVGFVFVVLLPGAVVVSVNRTRQERRIARAFWQLLRRRS